MVGDDTTQYYSSNRAKYVYLLLLYASQDFDKASLCTLFNILLDKIMCPHTVKLLYYMYTNQSCLNHLSYCEKENGVILTLLFKVYIERCSRVDWPWFFDMQMILF